MVADGSCGPELTGAGGAARRSPSALAAFASSTCWLKGIPSGTVVMRTITALRWLQVPMDQNSPPP